jgi:chromosome segregation ATPase
MAELQQQVAALQADKQQLQTANMQLQADKQQLQQQLAGLQPLQEKLQASEAMLRTCRSQLSQAELSHATEKSRLQQQLNAAQQQVLAANNIRCNNAVATEALNQAKEQAAQYKAQADENAARLAELQEQLNNQQSKVSNFEIEKNALLQSVQKLLATNQGLQAELSRLKQVGVCWAVLNAHSSSCLISIC